MLTEPKLRRPGIDIERLVGLSADPALRGLERREAKLLEMEYRYSGYIARQHREIAHLRREEKRPIPSRIDYGTISGLSTEVIEKLEAVRPASLGQAARISGITPAAVALIRIQLERYRRETAVVRAPDPGRSRSPRPPAAG